ncbi:MAG: S-formylglutathione hydrolase [Myxococcota bacterium]
MNGISVEKRWVSFAGEQQLVRHGSDTIGLPMELEVYLPPAALRGEACPTVTFLSGLTCTPENFTTKAGAQRVAADLGLILVMPDTSPRGAELPGEEEAWDFGTGAGFYLDATQRPWAQHYRMWSYITEELPQLVETHFPTDGRRSIFGHSMGGHGALVVGLRRPDRYASISAFAPICAPSQVPWGQKAFTGYLGKDRSAWARYDATELVAAHQHPNPILIDQGLADGFLHDQLKPELFVDACATAEQACEYRAHENYDHSYFFIASFVEDHLRHHARYLGR